MSHSFFIMSDECEVRFTSDEYHMLDSCNLCKKHLAGKVDIFMYRGDTSFCSEECRQEHIEKDEAMEMTNKIRLSASSRKKRVSSSTTKTEKQVNVRSASTILAS